MSSRICTIERSLETRVQDKAQPAASMQPAVSRFRGALPGRPPASGEPFVSLPAAGAEAVLSS
jgi:hypothetical protein